VNINRYLLASLASFIFIFLFEVLFHGNILGPAYERTAHLWRSNAQMNQFIHWTLISQILKALIIAFIFTRYHKGKKITEGLRFGAMIGLLLGIMQFSTYAYMPIPFGLALSWFIGAMFQYTAIGIILSVIYKYKD
jgi:hypothetical protein